MKRKKGPQRRVVARDADGQKVLKKLGQAITSIAAQQKIGLKQLAYEAGVSKGFIYDLAKGQGNPSILLLYRIAEANGITISKLLSTL